MPATKANPFLSVQLISEKSHDPLTDVIASTLSRTSCRERTKASSARFKLRQLLRTEKQRLRKESVMHVKPFYPQSRLRSNTDQIQFLFPFDISNGNHKILHWGDAIAACTEYTMMSCCLFFGSSHNNSNPFSECFHQSCVLSRARASLETPD